MTDAAARAGDGSVFGLSTVGPAPEPGPDRVLGRARHSHRRVRSASSGPRDLVTLPLVFVVGSLITWARAPEVILHPGLWAEDGTVFFQSAYNLGWHAPLTHTYAGYLQTFTRLVADIGLLVPLNGLPLFFVAVAVVGQVLPAVLVSSSRFAKVVPDYRVRLLLAAVYLIVPNSSEINVNLVDVQWHLAVLAVLVVLAAPAVGVWWVFDIATMVLSCLTGPFVLSLLLIVIIVYYRRRQRWTLVLGGIAAVASAIQIVELLTAPRGAHAPLGITASRLAEILGDRIIGNTVLGTATSTSSSFTSHLMVFSILFVICAAAIVGFAMWRGPFELTMFNLWAGLSLAGALASPLVSLHGSQWQALIGDPGSRYWFFPSLAFLADVIWLAGQRGTVRRWAAAGAILVLVAVAAFGVREDFRYPTVAAPNWQAQVRVFDRLPSGKSYAFRLRPRGWTMTLTKK